MDNNFSERLRNLLKKNKLSQQNVADILDIPRNTIWRWLNNRAMPNSDILPSLANILHITVDELLNGETSQGWVLQIKINKDFQEEFIDMRKGVPCISDLNITPNGVFLSLGGNFDLWTSDKKYKNFVKSLDKARKIVIQNAKDLGFIEE